MDFDQIQIGKVGISVLMTAVLAFIYRFCQRDDGTECFSNRGKQLIAVALGMVLAYVAMFYVGEKATFKNIVDFFVTGLVLGLQAIGIWEVYNPKNNKK